MPSVFHTGTPLAASAEVMFGFHRDPANLTQVMPQRSIWCCFSNTATTAPENGRWRLES